MEDYVTYGDEWEKAVMKLTKREIVEMLRNAGRELESIKLNPSND